MYTDYYHLKEPPFSITPDPSYLYLGKRHREALAHLVYGIKEGNGFVVLSGEVGTGKTTVCRYLLEHMPDNTDSALILNPKLNAYELLAALCDELGVDYPKEERSSKTLFDKLSEYLLDAHRREKHTVLIIDEAQNLTPDALEQIRLLTNLETNKEKLIQIILLGQPELNDLLAQPGLRQVAQRITARYHLAPLTLEDCEAYIKHRLAIAGVGQPLFDKSAIKLVYKHSGGIPRLINILCDRALLGAYAKNAKNVNGRIVKQAASEILPKTHKNNAPLPVAALAMTATVGVVILGGLLWQNLSTPDISIAENFKPQETVIATPATSQPPTEPVQLAKLVAETSQKSLTRQTQQPSLAADDIKTEVSISAPQIVKTQEAKPALPDDKLSAKALPSLAAVLKTGAETTSESLAFSSLFSVWKLSFRPDNQHSTPCEFANDYGLACLVRQGNWQDIQHTNRPAILRLYDQQEQQHFVVLKELNSDTATLRIGDNDLSYPLNEINAHWFGDYTLLWKPPLAYTGPLGLGAEGLPVKWLQRQLNSFAGNSTAGDLFDQRLHKEVVNFQELHGLQPDGIVGEQTIIQMNTLSGNARIPRLSQNLASPSIEVN